MAEKLRLAVNVANVLSRIHDQQVMHKDMSSGNILVADNDQPGSQDGVYIIDFGIASTMRQESASSLAPDDALMGTLAYISPEQTGRMNRQVDYRTDLYSLGVILYELFTGQLPFESGDALEMIHAHIARQPAAAPPDRARHPRPGVRDYSQTAGQERRGSLPDSPRPAGRPQALFRPMAKQRSD